MASLNNIFNSNVFEVEPTKFSCDPLILSCVRYRLPQKHQSLLSVGIEDDVTEEDKVLAESIRKYYVGEFIKVGLLGKPLSKYRQDLCSFVNEVKFELSSENEGMVYRLPEFYFYDTEVDAIPEKYSVKSASENSLEFSYVLEPLFRQVRKTRRESNYQYWFKTPSQEAVCITIETDNKLIKLWEQLFNSKTYVTLTGVSKVVSKSNFSFISLHKWKL
jgi:hypothetical protein